MTNGGPVFVYVKDGTIIRLTPIDLADSDGASWTIEARGLKLAPPRGPRWRRTVERQVDRLLRPIGCSIP